MVTEVLINTCIPSQGRVKAFVKGLTPVYFTFLSRGTIFIKGFTYFPAFINSIYINLVAFINKKIYLQHTGKNLVLVPFYFKTTISHSCSAVINNPNNFTLNRWLCIVRGNDTSILTINTHKIEGG